MPTPSIISSIRQILGRAFRETGQALDRLGIQGTFHANKSHITSPLEAYTFDKPLSRHRNIMPLLKRGAPQIIDPEKTSFIAPCSTIIGNVTINKDCSIWYGAILRADSCLYGMGHKSDVYEEWRELPTSALNRERDVDSVSGGGGICIGQGTNVQDGSIITSQTDHTIVGNNVTIGHSAQIHSSKIGDNTLIGMGSIIMEGSKIGDNVLIGAGSVISRNSVIDDGELWVGNPARKLRDLSEQEKSKLKYQGEQYVKVASIHIDVMKLGGNLPIVVEEEELEELPPLIESSSADNTSISHINETKNKSK